jgi:molecular chaperone GrpE
MAKVIKKQKSSEIDELKNQLARALADYDNLKKRTDEEKLIWIKFAAQKFVQNLLPVLDIFENAQRHLKDQGLAIGIVQLKDLLKSEGIIEINPKAGQKYDENLEEVIEVVEGKEDGMIFEVVTSGWKFENGPVVRHAKVRVTKKGLDK